MNDDPKNISIRPTRARLILGTCGALMLLALVGLAALVGLIAWLALSFWPEQPPPKSGSRYSILDVSIPDAVISMSYSPDAKYIAAGSRYYRGTATIWEGDLFVWDAQTGKELCRKHFRQWVQSIAFHPNGKHVAISLSSNLNGCPDGFLEFPQDPGEVQVFEFPSMKTTRKLAFPQNLVGMVQFSPDGNTLAVVRQPGTRTTGISEIVLYDFPALTQRISVPEVRRQSALVPRIVFSPDSKAIIATNHFPFTLDDKVVAYDAKTGEMGKWVGKLPPWNHIQRTHDGLLVVSGPSLMVYDYVKEEYPEEFKALLAKRDRLSEIRCASLSPDRKQIVAITQKGARRPLTTKVVVEQVASNELIDVLQAEDATFNRCCWSPDGKSFAVGTDGYRGIHGNPGGRLSGHVLIFRPKE